MVTAAKAKDKKEVRDIRVEALKIANAQHVEGQTKEQTRLIAKGIQRGMEQYLRQQSERARELDKRAKRVKRLAEAAKESSDPDVSIEPNVRPKTARLPWILLVMSWSFFLLYALRLLPVNL